VLFLPKRVAKDSNRGGRAFIANAKPHHRNSNVLFVASRFSGSSVLN
jgi:hypothetical protein